MTAASSPHSCVSAEDIEFYQANGYLRLPQETHGLFDDLEKLQGWVAEISQWGLETGKWRHYYETTNGKHLLWGTEKLIEYHAPMRDLIAGEAPLALLKTLTGKDMVVFKDEIAWKLPGGKGAVAHLDRPAYSMFAPEFIEIMIAVDAHTVENGCLEFVPGSHKEAVPISADGRIASAWLEGKEFIPMVLEPGDILIFNESMAHRLEPNKTDQRRAAVIGTYHFDLSQPDLRCKFYAHRLIHSPPENARVETVRAQT
uniref:LolE n=1 Tax=Atkinsonella hypoxylon TaxID=47741 RepID=W8EEV1_9HYPO|nr:LolE [Atkinsonella hypoxylon]